MPRNGLDFRRRAQLTELMDEPCSRDELRSCLRDLARINRWFLGYRPLLHWLDRMLPARSAEPLHIVDVGCGYGDGLRAIERWSHARGVPVALTGLDINPDTVAIAAEATSHASRIRWVSTNIFAYSPKEPVHIVLSSLFTHHLDEPDVIRFLQWMEQYAERGWFINDLSRSATPYHLFRAFSKLAGMHPFVQHDGPVSFRRAFVPEDWRRMCAAAGLDESAITVCGFKPARLCVGRRKAR